MFRRQGVATAHRPAEEPYQKAAQIWDERIGSARVQAKNWRIMAFVSLICRGLALSLSGDFFFSVRGTSHTLVVAGRSPGQAAGDRAANQTISRRRADRLSPRRFMRI